MLQLYFIFLVQFSLFSRHCTYAVVKFRHKKHLVRVKMSVLVATGWQPSRL